jgi:hypothetical protein
MGKWLIDNAINRSENPAIQPAATMCPVDLDGDFPQWQDNIKHRKTKRESHRANLKISVAVGGDS